jgi:hypothetical protein
MREPDKSASVKLVTSELKIRRGSIQIYRVFDIAEEIDLRQVETLIAQQRGGGESRLRLAKPGRNAIIIRNAPVRINLGETDLSFLGQTFKAETWATVWDYGVLSIMFQIPMPPGMPWGELQRISALINSDTGDETEIDRVARAKERELTRLLQPSVKKPGEWMVAEDYAIYFFEQIDGVTTGSDLMKKADLPALILGENDPLSDKARQGIVENTFQYAETDLAVIDWNSAVVLEPSGSRDISDVLEFALTHLLEVRYYDDLLDRRLSELYDEVETRRQRIWRSQFGAISKYANTRFLEFSEFMERIDNSLKVVGDFYLAVIFRAAVRRFRIVDWEQNITRKINLLARVSDLLHGEINVYRSQLLEIIIILLILFEVISAIVKVR